MKKSSLEITTVFSLQPILAGWLPTPRPTHNKEAFLRRPQLDLALDTVVPPWTTGTHEHPGLWPMSGNGELGYH